MSSLSKAERSYIQTGLLSDTPRRQDGRSLHEFRSIALETGVAPLANGSAHLHIGRNDDGSGGTEILSAVKLEVQTIEEGGVDDGRIVCSVSWFVFFQSPVPTDFHGHIIKTALPPLTPIFPLAL